MLSLIYLGAALLGTGLHLALTRGPRNTYRVVEIFLLYLFLFCVGIQGMINAYAHSFRAAETAKMIGWAPGSPFQFEVAMGNLALGISGLLALRFRQGYWLALSIFNAVFLWGCAYGHFVQERLGDTAPYNTGVFLWVGDMMVPALILLLVLIYRKASPTPLLRNG